MASPLGQILTTLAWSGWGAVGAGAWGSAHRSWSIDPEALLLLTGSLEDRDPRLHSESLQWVGSYHHLLSRTRLRRLLATWPSAPEWGAYAAQLGVVTGQTWPGAGDRVGGYEPAKGGQRVGEQLVLRLRAGMGVGVRSEILRMMLAGSVPTPATAAELTGEAAYGKRSIAAAAEQMAVAGILIGTARGNAIAFRLRDPGSWTSLFGPVPEVSLSFMSVCRAGAALLRGLAVDEGAGELGDGGEIVRTVATRHALRDAGADLATLGVNPPRLTPGADAYEQVVCFAENAFGRLAAGETP